LALEKENLGDVERFMPIIRDHKTLLDTLPYSVACDSGYASQENIT
jgi:IS5 family transposase